MHVTAPVSLISPTIVPFGGFSAPLSLSRMPLRKGSPIAAVTRSPGLAGVLCSTLPKDPTIGLVTTRIRPSGASGKPIWHHIGSGLAGRHTNSNISVSGCYPELGPSNSIHWHLSSGQSGFRPMINRRVNMAALNQCEIFPMVNIIQNALG
ncbi:hypothetical protein BDV34DRAFT_88228 [Aspergillus parasiticus]|uniref:Uncharacterized protein n=1 Tax=Aspergillus parasiticus TaxID=5067 RepID=A0A5N6E5K1_ASPPA|nr:hypothetical protein BDV34DRAFT_88228 [Aspergillus parasiticus]